MQEIPATRLERRKARTRAALVDAACDLLATPQGTEARISDITNRADVGLGSFYNHFASKSELFEVAISTVLELHGRLFDEACAGLDDPAEVFAAGVRMTLRMRVTHPKVAHTMIQVGFRYLDSPEGLAPRAYRDLEAAAASGRLDIDNTAMAVACTAGALFGCIHLLEHDSSLDTDSVADDLAASLLTMFGLTKSEAREVSRRPLNQPTLT
ncbi:TetR/AcrR family transcriptional regulator [Williamsia sp. 1135]|uniref:TetR/AcrR family transcriptional regulator n=1 Tax=Williamsia sp. 1135 TaxID=1889262 RepID=UPI000A121BFD|nr:TetR/AcrR family transcriptional regulator [Williamsia sp. 1135]ORM37887.1 TetR family transcriptional regulator [Williamsia sp. 1135]